MDVDLSDCKVSWLLSDQTWDISKLENSFGLELIYWILAIPTSERDNMDKWIWTTYTSGRAKPNNVYHFLVEGPNKSVDSKLWQAILKMRVPPDDLNLPLSSFGTNPPHWGFFEQTSRSS